MVITILSDFKFLVTCSSCTRHIEVTVIFPSSVQNPKSYVTLSSIYSLLMRRYEFLICNDCYKLFRQLLSNFGIDHVHFQQLWSYSVFENYIYGCNLNKDRVSVSSRTVHCFIKIASRDMLKKICLPKKCIEFKSLAPIFNFPFVGGEIRVFYDRERQRISGGTIFDMINKMKRRGKKQALDFQRDVVERDVAQCSSAVITEIDQPNEEQPAENGASSLADQRRDVNLIGTLMVYDNDFQFSVNCNGCLRCIEISVIMPPGAQYSQTYISLKNVYSIMQDQLEFMFCESCYDFIDRLAVDCEVDSTAIFHDVWSDTLIGAYISRINFHEDFGIIVQYSFNHCFLEIRDRDTFDRMCNFKNCIEFRPCNATMQMADLESTSSTSASNLSVEAERINDVSSVLDAWEQQNIAGFKRFFTGSNDETARAERGGKKQTKIRLLGAAEAPDSDSSSSDDDDDDVGAKLILLPPVRRSIEESPNPTNNMSTADRPEDSTNGTNESEREPLPIVAENRNLISNSEDDSLSSLSSYDDEDVGAELILLQPSRRNIGIEKGDVRTQSDVGSNDQPQNANRNSNVPIVNYFDRFIDEKNKAKRGNKKEKELFMPCSTEVDNFMAEEPEPLHNIWMPNSSSQIPYNAVDGELDSSSEVSDDDVVPELILIQPFGATHHIRLQNGGAGLPDQNEAANPSNQPIVDYSDGSVRIVIYESEEDASDESENDGQDHA